MFCQRSRLARTCDQAIHDCAVATVLRTVRYRVLHSYPSLGEVNVKPKNIKCKM